MKGSLMLYNLN